MSEMPLQFLVKDSIQIAWNYLERTGELEEPDIASRVLLGCSRVNAATGRAQSPATVGP
jgi:hypothetical protein